MDNPPEEELKLNTLNDDVLNLIGTQCNFNLCNLRESCKTGKVISQHYWELFSFFKIIRIRYSNSFLMERIGLIEHTKSFKWETYNTILKKIKDGIVTLDLESYWKMKYITQFGTIIFLTEKSIIEKLIFIHVY